LNLHGQLEAARQEFDALYKNDVPAFNQVVAGKGIQKIMTVAAP